MAQFPPLSVWLVAQTVAPVRFSWDATTTVLTAVMALLGFLSYRLNGRSNRSTEALNAANASRNALETEVKTLQRRLAELEDYARSTPVIEYLYQDIVLIGPRNSGKTSVAELWTQPWVDIETLSQTEYWTPYNASIYEFRSEKRMDSRFRVERAYDKILRLRIHDHPGEDRSRVDALRRLPRLQSNAVLLLFFDVQADEQGVVSSNQNNVYYSKAFMDSIEQQRSITSKLSRVIVVFNKMDLLPADWTHERRKQELVRSNADAIQRIESLFSGKLEYQFVSARTNAGLIALLGAAGSCGLSPETKSKFEDHLKKLFQGNSRADEGRPIGRKAS